MHFYFDPNAARPVPQRWRQWLGGSNTKFIDKETRGRIHRPSGKRSGPRGAQLIRFFAASATSVDRFVVRDCDDMGALGPRDKAAVDEWIVSGRMVHILRDDPARRNPRDGPKQHRAMRGGAWGALRNAIQYDAVEGVIRSGAAERFFHMPGGGDSAFLDRFVWPALRPWRDVLAHDAFDCSAWPASKAFPTRRRNSWDWIGAPAVLNWPKAIAQARDAKAEGGEKPTKQRRGVPLDIHYLDDGEGDTPGVRGVPGGDDAKQLAALLEGDAASKWEVYDEEVGSGKRPIKVVARDNKPTFDAKGDLAAARKRFGPHSDTAEICK